MDNAGQVLDTTWVIFAVFEGQRVTFTGQICRHPPNTELEVMPLERTPLPQSNVQTAS